jgi:hypothetical protein
MKRRLGKPSKIFLAITATVYSAYLLKTLLGINISSRYSAPWIVKLPLEPLLSHKSTLCAEFQTLCTLRSQILHRVQPRIEKAKRAV